MHSVPAVGMMHGMSVTKRDIPYKTVDDVTLRLWVFEDEADRTDAHRPAIVFFFGGGWTGGTPEQFFPQCEYFASRGMLAASAEYRVKDRHGTTPFECVADGKSAVRWLRAHADELRIDPDRIAAGGGSAGGHIALCTALIDGCEEPGEDLSVSSRPDALVCFKPAPDLTRYGNRVPESAGRVDEISPAHHVKAGAPPTILFHGIDDTSVPFEDDERFAAAMNEAGNDCRLVAYPEQVHGFFNYRDGDNPYYAETVREADRFLAKLGWLTGKPTMGETS